MVDLCERKGEDYLVFIDYYSRYIELAQLSGSTMSQAVIYEVKRIIARHVIPEVMVSDNDSQLLMEKV